MSCSGASERKMASSEGFFRHSVSHFSDTSDSDSSDVSSETSELMSADEEDDIDRLLQAQTYPSDSDDEFQPDKCYCSSQETGTTASQSSMGDDPITSTFSWKDENVKDEEAPSPPEFAPKKPVGLQLGRFTRSKREQMRSPVNFFKLFLTPTLILQICIATNQFAEKLISDGQYQSYANTKREWDRVTVEEMYRFWAVVIYMSIVKYQSYSRYWSTSPLYKGNPVQTSMTKRQFQAILSFLQVTPLPDVDKDDKLTRVRPLIQHVRAVSRELFQPYQNISADERMLPSKHQYSGIRQFVKNKPVRFGLKLWVLACSVTGYTFEFSVYLGKKFTRLNDHSKSLGYNIVIDLIPSFTHQGYVLFLDCFYTSIDLVKKLLDMGIFAVGVLKTHSKSLPECFRDSKKWEKVAVRGDFRWHRTDKMVVVQWKDSKTVSLLSTAHSGSEITSCHRALPGRTGWKKKRLTQPKIIADYNKYMGGVDKSDQYLSKYPCYIRSHFHWWKVLFFHCVDIMIVNSYIIFVEYMRNFPNNISVPSTFGQLEFREEIVNSLLRSESSPVSLQSTSHKCLPEFMSVRHNCALCSARARLAGKPHPTTKTFVFCIKCQVYLCMTKERNCFHCWHTEKCRKEKEWFKSNSRNQH